MLRNPAVSIPTFSIESPSTRRVTRASGWLTQNVELALPTADNTRAIQ